MDMELADGTRIRAGEPVGVLHLWNEHLLRIPPDGADLRWAMAMRRLMQFTLRELATASTVDPRLARARAFGGTALFASRGGSSHVASMAARFGFEWIPEMRKPSLLRAIHDFFQNFLVFGLVWAFNPAGLRGKGFIRPRDRLFLSRQALLDRFQDAGGGPESLQPVTLVD
jgi:hypothetical protein